MSIIDLPINVIENILNYLFIYEDLRLEHLLKLKKTCKTLFVIISNYIKYFIKNKEIFTFKYQDNIKNNNPRIYLFINKNKKIIEKKYIKIINKNKNIYSYNYFIYINKLEEIYKLLYLNIFKGISLKNLIFLQDINEFSYVSNYKEYIINNSFSFKYIPILNNMQIFFGHKKELPNYILYDLLENIKNIKNLNILEINCYYKYKLEYIYKILDYIYINNIVIKVLKWYIYVNINILQQLYLNDNISKVIITNHNSKKYINNKKHKEIFKEKIKVNV